MKAHRDPPSVPKPTEARWRARPGRPGAETRPLRFRELARTCLLVTACIAVAATIALTLFLHRRGPLTSGAIRLPGLSAAVTVERDALAVPRIRATCAEDAYRALGFLHAQERFFQMDLLRRTAAGEQAELLGPTAVGADLNHRLHQFRARARAAVAALDPAGRARLLAYTAGVNAGLGALRIRPIEYLLLQTEPAPWRPEDSLLVIFTLFISLQDSQGDLDAIRGAARDRLDQATYTFLFANGSSWSSTLDGSAPTLLDPPVHLRLPPVPRTPARASVEPTAEAFTAGSNAWVVRGSLTASGRALLANDLHLALAMPGLWYRADLAYQDPDDKPRALTGITLPGLPLVLVGSNGHVAWGFTNTAIDTVDLVSLELDPDDPNRYATPSGWRPFVEEIETITVRGAPAVELTVRRTPWGPVRPEAASTSSPRAILWMAHQPGAANLGLSALETIDDAPAAVAAAHQIGLPPMNLLVADAAGNIGWTIVGSLPLRLGFGGTTPASFADGACRWEGVMDASALPAIVNPPGERLWNANNWSLEPDPAFADGGFDDGGRAHQIAEVLAAGTRFTEKDFLRLQHDDRARYFQRWAKLLAEVIARSPRLSPARRVELRRLLVRWDGRASADSAAYALVHDFRATALAQTVRHLLGDHDASVELALGRFNFEEPVWQLLQQTRSEDGDARLPGSAEFLEETLQAVLRASDEHHGANCPFARRTWGSRNQLAARHPLSALFPFLSRWFDLPSIPLDGDNHMPLVAGPQFGASARIVVSPGAESRGLLQMPGGQSGDPFSDHYSDHLTSWRSLRGLPLLSGRAIQTLNLLPADKK